MRLFGLVSGMVDHRDRADYMTPPFDRRWRSGPFRAEAVGAFDAGSEANDVHLAGTEAVGVHVTGDVEGEIGVG